MILHPGNINSTTTAINTITNDANNNILLPSFNAQ